MGPSVPSQVTWMNGVVTQFHKQFPQYKHTKVVVDWIPWGNRVTDWTNALTSGKGGPDITELGNTDTPGIASQGALANITSDVKAWSKARTSSRATWPTTPSSGNNYAVPWFGGVRGIWYRKDQFAKAGISSPPTTWAQLVADAKLLMKKYPGTLRPGRAEQLHQRHRQLHLGRRRPGRGAAERQVGGRAEHPAVRGRHQVLRRPVPDRARVAAKYIGQTELGAPGATSGGSDEDFAKGKLDMYIDGPWAKSSLDRREHASTSRSGPRSRSRARTARTRPRPSPAAPTSGVWAKSPNQTAAWDLVTVMDSPANATTFANPQGFFPEFTSALSGSATRATRCWPGSPRRPPTPRSRR